RGMDQLSAIRGWTDEVLALVEIEAGLTGQEAIDLAELIEDRLEDFQGDLFRQKELSLSWESDGSGPRVAVEPTERLVDHFVEQAAWRSDRGGEIQLRLERQGNQC
ncbi:MAG: hypothetical protein GWN71_20815, partial [Gammaproteobacteria bacterium]|nr:hypothetical protein [Gemmatimonadota bacterium]NIU75917.1 hypothetical protein [Gammaproteobacteria bacterium]